MPPTRLRGLFYMVLHNYFVCVYDMVYVRFMQAYPASVASHKACVKSLYLKTLLHNSLGPKSLLSLNSLSIVVATYGVEFTNLMISCSSLIQEVLPFEL